jgi:hypothetical protein
MLYSGRSKSSSFPSPLSASLEEVEPLSADMMGGGRNPHYHDHESTDDAHDDDNDDDDDDDDVLNNHNNPSSNINIAAERDVFNSLISFANDTGPLDDDSELELQHLQTAMLDSLKDQHRNVTRIISTTTPRTRVQVNAGTRTPMTEVDEMMFSFEEGSTMAPSSDNTTTTTINSGHHSIDVSNSSSDGGGSQVERSVEIDSEGFVDSLFISPGAPGVSSPHPPPASTSNSDSSKQHISF